MLSKESRLESWNCLLSKEIVKCWIKEESKVPEFNKFLGLLSILNLEATDKLFQDLEVKIQEIQASDQNPPSWAKLTYVQEHLFDWYYEVYLKELNLKFQEPRIKTRDRFKTFINSFWLESSLKSALDFATKIEQLVLSQSKQYCQSKKTFLQQENGGKKSFNFLSQKLTAKEEEGNISKNYNSAIRALLHIYKCKIQSEICDFKIQIASAIIQDNQLVIENLLEANSFLNQLQESFSSSNQNNSLLMSMLFEQMCLVKSPGDLRQDLEKDLGIPLNRWGSCGYISLEEVEKILLEKVGVISKDIYGQLIKELTSEANLNQPKNNHLQVLAATN